MSSSKWTVWIIVQQDGDHLLEYDFMLRSIIKSRLKLDKKYWELLRFIVFHYDKSRQQATILQLEEFSNEAPFPKTMLRFVQKEKLAKEQSDLYDENVLISFMKKYDLPDNKNMVVLWGHGNGFGLGYFSQWSEHSLKLNYFKGISSDKRSPALLNKVNKIVNIYLTVRAILSYPEKNELVVPGNNKLLSLDFLDADEKKRINNNGHFQQLTSAQLSTIFISALGRKVNLLLVNSCYMQMLESIPFFSTAVDYIVGCQTSFPFLGYHFETVFDTFSNTIEEDTATQTKTLAVASVKSFTAKYNTQPFISTLKHYYQEDGINYDIKGLISVSAISFASLNNYLAAINEIGKYFADNFDTVKNHVTDAYRNIKSVIIESPFTLFIDAEIFFTEYNKQDRQFKPFFRNFKKSNTMIFSFKKADKNEGRPRGLSILLPKSVDDNDVKEIIITLVDEAFKPNTPLSNCIPNWGVFLKKWLMQL